MKKFLFTCLLALIATTTFAAVRVDDKPDCFVFEHQNAKVYYVVLGSFSSLKEAKRFNYYAPDGLECNIYSARVKGKVVYRCSCNVFKSATTAHECAREIQKCYGINAWVWASNGLAKCVHRETGLSGEPISIYPK